MSVFTKNGKALLHDGKALNLDGLIALANATTGEDDKTLAAAVASLIEGYGGGWSEKIVATTLTNVYDCLNALIGTIENGHIYLCLKTTLIQSEYANNQLIAFALQRTGNAWVGGGVRYRDGAYVGIPNYATTTALTISAGEKYLFLDGGGHETV